MIQITISTNTITSANGRITAMPLTPKTAIAPKTTTVNVINRIVNRIINHPPFHKSKCKFREKSKKRTEVPLLLFF